MHMQPLDIIGQICWVLMFASPLITLPITWRMTHLRKSYRIFLGIVLVLFFSVMFYFISMSILFRQGMGPGWGRDVYLSNHLTIQRIMCSPLSAGEGPGVRPWCSSPTLCRPYGANGSIWYHSLIRCRPYGTRHLSNLGILIHILLRSVGVIVEIPDYVTLSNFNSTSWIKMASFAKRDVLSPFCYFAFLQHF